MVMIEVVTDGIHHVGSAYFKTRRMDHKFFTFAQLDSGVDDLSDTPHKRPRGHVRSCDRGVN